MQPLGIPPLSGPCDCVGLTPLFISHLDLVPYGGVNSYSYSYLSEPSDYATDASAATPNGAFLSGQFFLDALISAFLDAYPWQHQGLSKSLNWIAQPSGPRSKEKMRSRTTFCEVRRPYSEQICEPQARAVLHCICTSSA